MAIVWIAAAYLAGALPFSVWLGRWALRADIRRYGDGNPGATNALRAGGWKLGAAALLLDSLKAAIPVGLAYFGAGLQGAAMFAVAVAAPLGHAVSPFLGGRGGKAVAAVFGAWAGLTIGEAPIILGLFLAFWFALIAVDGWAVLLALLGLMGHLLWNHPDPLLIAVCAGHLLLMAYTHRADLARRPRLRKWLWQK